MASMKPNSCNFETKTSQAFDGSSQILEKSSFIGVQACIIKSVTPTSSILFLKESQYGLIGSQIWLKNF